MTLGLLLLVHFAALAVPGLDNLVVSQTSAQQGWRAGAWTGLGVVTAILLWATVTVAGLSFVVTQPLAHLAITLFGAAYLLWLAVDLLRHAIRPTLTDPSVGGSLASLPHCWLKGFITNLSNPKAVIYFTSIFAAFLTPATSWSTRGLMVAMIVFESLCWFALLSRLFSLPDVARRYHHRKVFIECGAALLFAGFAFYLLWHLWTTA